MGNYLKKEKIESVIHCLVEGTSVRSAERLTGVHRDTILKYLVRVGAGCESLMDSMMRDLPCRLLQIDEIWGFIGKKQKMLKPFDNPNELGDIWTFVAIDAESKLVPTYRVGQKSIDVVQDFMDDLKSRLRGKVQISTDAFSTYMYTIDNVFGPEVDFAQIVKTFETTLLDARKYSPPQVVNVEKNVIQGNPIIKHISTSYVERQNLTMRMSMRRLTRLTNAFSKKLDNLKAAVALHFAHYNLCRIHKTIRCTPAMEIGISRNIWSIDGLINAALESK